MLETENSCERNPLIRDKIGITKDNYLQENRNNIRDIKRHSRK